MTVKPGDTFYGDPRSLASQVQHLWVVVAVNSHELDDKCVLAIAVSVTSAKAGMDRSCVLQRGDHPFVHHESWLWYQGAVECPVADLVALQRRAPVSAELLSRIRQGLHRSKFTKRGLKAKVPQQ